MNLLKMTAHAGALICAAALTFGCSNPNEDYREVGTEFAQKLVDNDIDSLSSLRDGTAFGQGNGELEAMHRNMVRDCGAVQGISEDSVTSGPSVDADGTGTAVFSLQSENPCKLRVKMTLRGDQTKVERASVIVGSPDSE